MLKLDFWWWGIVVYICMSELIKESIKKNNPHFLKYKKYIEDNDWRILHWNEQGKPLSDSDVRKGEFDVQNQLVKAMLERIKAFIKRTEGDHHLKIFKDFVKQSLKIIKTHTDRADDYISVSDISKIKDVDLRAGEIAFHNHLYKAVSSIEDTVSAFNIREEQATEGIQWLDNQKATIPMYKSLVLQYPEIKIKLDAMGIDLDSPPKNDIHILNENPPKYNSEKNFWELEKDTIQYYFDELKKIDYGITVDGYYIDGWLYYHFNYFVTKIPTTVFKNGIKENEDIVTVPDLRDNEMVITDYFNKSKRDQLMSLIAASRRIAKTTLNSSRITRAQILGKKQILCAGGSSEDLGHISLNITTCNENINPAFRLYYLSKTTDGRGDAYGIKTKNNKSKVIANVFIINLEGGTKKGKGESLAGFSPDEFILDEAMKFPYKSQLQALEPALWGVGTLRCNVLITGTGGDEDLAVDAIQMLNDPEGNRITLMDWDTLERHVPKELITWQRKKFGLFLPTQMSIKHQKIKSNMADYLKIKSETLSKIPVWVTDWEQAKKSEDEERANKKKNKIDYVRLLAYHPYDPSEIFLSGKISIFNNIVEEAKSHKEYLLETGLWDRRRKLYKDSNGKIQCDISEQDLVTFPFIGATQYAPYLIIEEPDQEKLPRYYYVASGDFYKQDETTSTDSVGTIVIYKYPLFGDKSGKKIVATYAARPKRHKEFNESVLLLLEYYSAVLFPENEDMGQFKTFLEGKKLEEQYLEKHIDFNSTLVYSEISARAWGWTPKQSRSKLLSIFANYLEEDVEKTNDKGEKVVVKRVQTIDDIWLLSEIINFSEAGNYDRIFGAIGGTGLIHFLEKNYIYPKGNFKKNYEEEEKPREVKKINHYSVNRKRTFFNENRKR